MNFDLKVDQLSQTIALDVLNTIIQVIQYLIEHRWNLNLLRDKRHNCCGQLEKERGAQQRSINRRGYPSQSAKGLVLFPLESTLKVTPHLTIVLYQYMLSPILKTFKLKEFPIDSWPVFDSNVLLVSNCSESFPVTGLVCDLETPHQPLVRKKKKLLDSLAVASRSVSSS